MKVYGSLLLVDAAPLIIFFFSFQALTLTFHYFKKLSSHNFNGQSRSMDLLTGSRGARTKHQKYVLVVWWYHQHQTRFALTLPTSSVTT